MEERAVGKTLRSALSGNQPGVPYPCPDDNVLAAYVDGLLSEGDRLVFEEHASRCASCRQVLGLALKTSTESNAALAEHVSARPILWWLRSPFAAAAAAVIIVGVGAILFTFTSGPRSRMTAPQVSSLRVSPNETDRYSRQRVPAPPQSPTHNAPSTASGRNERETAAASQPAVRPALAPAAAPVAPPPPAAGALAGSSEPKLQAAAETPQVLAEDAAHPVDHSQLNKAVYAAREDAHMPARLAVARSEPSPAQALRTLLDVGAAAPEHRKLGELQFYRVGTYWIDARCAAQANQLIVDIPQGATEWREILSEIPGLTDLMQSGLRVMVVHGGRICLLPVQP